MKIKLLGIALLLLCSLAWAADVEEPVGITFEKLLFLDIPETQDVIALRIEGHQVANLVTIESGGKVTIHGEWEDSEYYLRKFLPSGTDVLSLESATGEQGMFIPVQVERHTGLIRIKQDD